MLFATVFAFVVVINSVVGVKDVYYPDELPGAIKNHDSFEWALTKRVIQDECKDCNVIISPFTIKLLLSLLHQCATDKTSDELSILLPDITIPDYIMDYWNDSLSSLQEKRNEFEISIASQIFVDKTISVKKVFIDLLKVYRSNVQTIDFSKVDQAVKEINKWVSEKTKNHIREMINEGDLHDTVALFLSAVYFNGLWEVPFPLKYTGTDNFSVSSRRNITAQIMYNTDQFNYTYSKALNSKILRIGYKGDKFAMYMILPNNIDGLRDLVDKLNSSIIEKELNTMQLSDVIVKIPKFKFDYTSNLKPTLQKLGIKKIFTSEAKLSRISDDKLMVSSVIQKTGIIVYEDGTIAYGAGKIGLTNRVSNDEFIANHPFIFFIKDETTGAVLFSGKVSKPEV